MGSLRIEHAAAKSLQSCPTLCDPIDSSPPGSPVPGILQARTLEWVAISSSNAWKWKVKVKSLSCVHLFGTPRTAAYQAPPIHGIFQARVQEWVALAFSSRTWLNNFHFHLYVIDFVHNTKCFKKELKECREKMIARFNFIIWNETMKVLKFPKCCEPTASTLNAKLSSTQARCLFKIAEQRIKVASSKRIFTFGVPK